MAKKLNNFYTLKDLLSRNFNYFDLRYFFCNANYRVQQNFTWEELEGVHQGLLRNVEKKQGSFSKEQIDISI